MGRRRNNLIVAIVVGLLTVTMAIPAGGTRPEDVVRTDHGPVRGTIAGPVRTFQGIPYAAPPAGELRWQPPQPAPRWRNPLDATAPRGSCAQPASAVGNPQSVNEDCLYLNVTTPRRARGRLPVMVWIHGGAYTNGNGANYDASKLAVEGAVVVTINYRLGAFGFLALPGLSGNLGIADQQAALRWVRRTTSTSSPTISSATSSTRPAARAHPGHTSARASA